MTKRYEKLSKLFDEQIETLKELTRLYEEIILRSLRGDNATK